MHGESEQLVMQLIIQSMWRKMLSGEYEEQVLLVMQPISYKPCCEAAPKSCETC